MKLTDTIIAFDKVTSFGSRKSLNGHNKRELVIFLARLKTDLETKAPLLAQACDCILQNLRPGASKAKIERGINRLERDDKKTVLSHLANLEEAISATFRGYHRLSSAKSNPSLMQNALKELDLDLSIIQFFSPRTYDEVLQRMDDMDVVKVLHELQADPSLSEADATRRESKLQQIYDFNNWIRENCLRSNAVPVLIQCQLKKLTHELSTLGENIHACADHSRASAVAGSIGSELARAAGDQVREESSRKLSSTVNPLPIRKQLESCRNNHFMGGLAKIGAGLAASLMSTVLAVASMSAAPTNITKSNIANNTNVTIDQTPSSSDTKASADPASHSGSNATKKKLADNAQSFKINSSDYAGKSGMSGNPGMQAGELGQGAMVYTAEAKSSKNPFLINKITHYVGDGQQVHTMNIDKYSQNQGETLQTIHLAKNNYQQGETISLLVQPDGVSTISNIHMNKPCSWSLVGNKLTLNEAVDGLEITYDICKPNADTRINLPINEDFLPGALAPAAEQLRASTKSGSFSELEASNYLSNFTYMVSSEIQRLIDKMPGAQERNLSFLRVGDCDMFSDHLAWLLQGNLRCGIGHGYIDTNGDGKVYSSDGHARFMYQNQNHISDFETTTPTKAAYIIPDESFKPEDLKSLETIVDQINAAQNQEDRDQLMTGFGKKLNEILQDPYYQKFIGKSNEGNASEQNSSKTAELPKDKKVNHAHHDRRNYKSSNTEELDTNIFFNPYTGKPDLLLMTLGALGAISAVGFGSFAVGGKKRFDRLLQESYPFIDRSSKTGALQVMAMLPVEGARVLLRPPYLLAKAPIDMHRAWTDKVRDQSREGVSELLEGDNSILKDSFKILLQSLTQLKDNHRVAIPKTQFERVIKPFAELATKVAPPYRPLWKQITVDLEQIADEGLTRSNVLGLIRKHFESVDLREKFLSEIPELVENLVATPAPAYRDIEQISRAVKHEQNTAGSYDGSRSSRRTGSGGDFHQHRDHQPGEGLRHIDWNASSRLDPTEPYQVKTYTDTSGDPRTTHSIAVLVDTHDIASSPEHLKDLVSLLRLSMMKDPAIKVKIDIYSCGELIDRIDEKDIQNALWRSRDNPSSAISGILTTILKTAAEDAIFVESNNPLNYQSKIGIDPSRYPQTNIWGGSVTNLLDKLQGRESKFESAKYRLNECPLRYDGNSAVILGNGISANFSQIAQRYKTYREVLAVRQGSAWANAYIAQACERIQRHNKTVKKP